MKYPIVFAAAFAALIPSASSAQSDADLRSAVSAAREAAARAASPRRLLDSTLTAMNDGPATGGLLAGWLRENRAVIEFHAPSSGLSSHEWLGRERRLPLIVLDRSLAAEPLSCRFLAVFVARETAELMLGDFPESAEKRYIVASRSAETFFELGGTRATMDDIDGHRNGSVEELLRLWVEHDPEGGVADLHGRGVPVLSDIRARAAAEASRLAQLKHIIEDQMLSIPGDPNAASFREELARTEKALDEARRTRERAEAAQKEFESFKVRERDWLWQNQGLLR